MLQGMYKKNIKTYMVFSRIPKKIEYYIEISNTCPIHENVIWTRTYLNGCRVRG